MLLLGATAMGAVAQEPQIGTRTFSEAESSAAKSYWTGDRLSTARPESNFLKEPSPALGTEVTPSEPAVMYPSEGPDKNTQITNLFQPPPVEELNPIPAAFENQYPYPFTRFNVYRHLYASNAIPPVFPYRTIGKLFFTDQNGNNAVCSASVIRPHLVLTARHCIFNYVNPQGGQFFTNVIFYPGWYCPASPCAVSSSG